MKNSSDLKYDLKGWYREKLYSCWTITIFDVNGRFVLEQDLTQNSVYRRFENGSLFLHFKWQGKCV